MKVIIYIVWWCILTPIEIQIPQHDEFYRELQPKDTIIYTCSKDHKKEFDDKQYALEFMERGFAESDIKIIALDSVMPAIIWYGYPNYIQQKFINLESGGCNMWILPIKYQNTHYDSITLIDKKIYKRHLNDSIGWYNVISYGAK